MKITGPAFLLISVGGTSTTGFCTRPCSNCDQEKRLIADLDASSRNRRRAGVKAPVLHIFWRGPELERGRRGNGAVPNNLCLHAAVERKTAGPGGVGSHGARSRHRRACQPTH